MFENEFYPTNEETIKLMLEPYREKKVSDDYRSHYYSRYIFHDCSILDPSAGSGNILLHIRKEQSNYRKIILEAIEIDPDLQSILKDQSITLIGSDFLEYGEEIFHNYIFMNPPFSNGDEHLLHAWNLMYCGDIVCLLNAETIRNPYTKKRKLLLDIINEHGSYEFIGSVFENAEVKTSVEVVLIRLHKKADNRFKSDFDNLKKENSEKITFDEYENNSVAVNDKIQLMIDSFNLAKEVYPEMVNSFRKMKSVVPYKIHNELNDFLFTCLKNSTQNGYAFFLKSIKKEMWKSVLSDPSFEKYATSKVKQNFEAFIRETSNLEFSKENVFSILKMLVTNRAQILADAAEEVFDYLTRYYEENRSYFEGWKSNEAWYVTKKMVIPNIVRPSWDKPHERKQYGFEFRMNWSIDRNFHDIEKVLSYISGIKYEQVTTISEALQYRFNKIGNIYPKDKYDSECESTFFKIKFYIKGTVHLVWKDDKLLEQFNYIVASKRKWVPEKTEPTAKKGGKKQEPGVEVFKDFTNDIVEQLTLF